MSSWSGSSHASARYCSLTNLNAGDEPRQGSVELTLLPHGIAADEVVGLKVSVGPLPPGSARADQHGGKRPGRCRIAPGARQARQPATYTLLLPKALSLMAEPPGCDSKSASRAHRRALRGRARLKMLSRSTSPSPNDRVRKRRSRGPGNHALARVVGVRSCGRAWRACGELPGPGTPIDFHGR